MASKARRIVTRVLGVLLILVIGGVLALQSPAVQSFLARKVLERIVGGIDGEVRFESLQLRPFHGFSASGVTVLDRHPYVPRRDSLAPPPDTLLHIGHVSATFNALSYLTDGALAIRSAHVNDVQFNLVRSPKDSTRNELNVLRVFGLGGNDASAREPLNLLTCRNLQVTGARFRYIDYAKLEARDSLRLKGMDYADMDFRFDLSATDFSILEDSYSATIRRLTCREKGGLAVDSMTGRLRLGPTDSELLDAVIADPSGSELHISRLAARYDAGSAVVEDLFRAVPVSLELEPSVLDVHSLLPYVPSLDGMNLRAKLEGRVSGPLDNLSFPSLRVEELSSGITAKLSGRLQNISAGVPEALRFDLDVDQLRATAAAVDRLVAGAAPGTDPGLRRLYKGGPVTLNAHAGGTPDAMDLRARVSDADGGQVRFEGRLAHLLSDRPAVIDGTAGTSRLDLGKILDIESLGTVTLDTRFAAELKPDGPEAKIYSLDVRDLRFAGYDYGQIYATGILGRNSYKGSIVSRDPNLDFLFGGQITLPTGTRDGKYAFTADVGYVDLSALHLDSRETAQLDFRLVADYRQTPDGDFLGDVHVRSLNLKDETGTHHVGNISLRSSSAEGDHRMELSSRFASGTFQGTEGIGRFVDDLLDATVRTSLSNLAGEPAGDPLRRGSYRLDFSLGDTREIFGFFLPSLYVAESTLLALRLGADGQMDARLTSDGLVWDSLFAKNLDVDMDNSDGYLSATVRSDEAGLGEITLRDNRIKTYAAENAIDIRYAFEMSGTQPGDGGDLHLRGFLSRDAEGENVVLTADVPSSHLVWFGTPWDLVARGVRYHDFDLEVDGLHLSSGNQSLRADGRLCPIDDAVMDFQLSDFDIDVANRLLARVGLDLGLKGQLSGRAQLISPYEDTPNLLARLRCENTFVSGYDAGTVHFESDYQDDEERFYVRLNDSGKTLDARGFIYPAASSAVDMRVRLDGFQMGVAAPILSSVFSDFEGLLTGDLNVTGPLDNLSIDGNDVRLADGLLQVDFTDVPYFVDGELLLSDHRMRFDSLKIRDRYEGTGRVRGGLSYPGFSDISYRLDLDVRRMEAIDLGKKQNSNFYGNLFATGNVAIDGDLSRFGLKVDARTERGGTLHIPFDYSVDATAGDLLRFVEPKTVERVNPLDSIITRKRSVSSTPTAIDVDIHVQATPDALVLMEIDPTTGNLLSARGEGGIDIGYHGDNFTIGGDYTVSSGNYHFSAIVASRDFEIETGSSVHFNGDIYDSDLDVQASYSTRASLAPLIADSTATRVPVVCKVSITDKLRNPSVALDIEVPQLDPTTQGLVSGALNTEDNIQRQFLSLLVSGNFLPSEQSGVVSTNSNLLFSNVSAIMSDQLSNILQTLGIPLDLGLNYQSTEGGNDLFDVAISTQLFNDRVIVNGSVGNRPYSASGTNTSEVAGDLDIAVKLNKTGSVRATFFSHSTDQYTNYLDTSQRNGAGFSYQKEFTTLCSLIRGMFLGQDWHSSAETLNSEGEDVVITIEAPENERER